MNGWPPVLVALQVELVLCQLVAQLPCEYAMIVPAVGSSLPRLSSIDGEHSSLTSVPEVEWAFEPNTPTYDCFTEQTLVNVSSTCALSYMRNANLPYRAHHHPGANGPCTP